MKTYPATLEGYREIGGMNMRPNSRTHTLGSMVFFSAASFLFYVSAHFNKWTSGLSMRDALFLAGLCKSSSSRPIQSCIVRISWNHGDCRQTSECKPPGFLLDLAIENYESWGKGEWAIIGLWGFVINAVGNYCRKKRLGKQDWLDFGWTGDWKLGRGSATKKLAGVWFDALALLEESDQWCSRTGPWQEADRDGPAAMTRRSGLP